MIASIITGIGSLASAFFGFKGKQAKVINSAMNIIGDVNRTSQERDVAAAQIIVAEANSESWLARTWRPLFMLVFMAIILSFWFGYTPPHLLGPMPEMIAEIFLIVKIGIGGYIPARSIEKTIKNLGLNKTLRTFIEKKLG